MRVEVINTIYFLILFWGSLLGVLYAYFLYPALLFLIKLFYSRPVKVGTGIYTPSVTIIMPVHNEEAVLCDKLFNLDQLNYPIEKLKIIIVSDGSTDNSVSLIREHKIRFDIRLIEINERKGKGNALNHGLKYADSEIIVFSDASILLEADSLMQIVIPFQDEAIGCVSGEDHIADGGGEGVYGQYELYLRNQESAVGSIVGASGSFYAERRRLCKPFEEGLAPDFLSVLNIVNQGFRAITQRTARGHMKSVKSSNQEFQRKVRTLLRGMAALFSRRHLLNPFKYGSFSLFLISHKVFRWLVPLFLLIVFMSNLFLVENIFYFFIFISQLVFYLMAAIAYSEKSSLHRSLIFKIPLFFVIVNLAIAVAWVHYFRGVRQELWNPSNRDDAKKS